MFFSPSDCEILEGGRHGISVCISLPNGCNVIPVSTGGIVSTVPGWAWETWLLQMNADFNNIWTDNKDGYGVNFSFCQMFSIKILIILTSDCKTRIKRVEQLWQPSVKFPDVWKQHYNDFISFNMDILELGRDKLKEPFFLRQWFSLGFLLFKSYAERQKELPYKNSLQN